MRLTNTVIRVHGLDQNDYVQAYNGAITGRIASYNVTYENTYAIAKGTLYCVESDGTNSAYKEMNKQTGVLFEDEASFVKAKVAGEITFDGYNGYWNLSGSIPQFR